GLQWEGGGGTLPPLGTCGSADRGASWRERSMKGGGGGPGLGSGAPAYFSRCSSRVVFRDQLALVVTNEPRNNKSAESVKRAQGVAPRGQSGPDCIAPVLAKA